MKKKKDKDSIEVCCPGCGHIFTGQRYKKARVSEFKCKKCTTVFTLSWSRDEEKLERRFRLGEDPY